MKVEGPGRTQQSSSSKKKGKVSGGDSSFGDMVSGSASKSEGSSAAHSINTVDSLLAVQAAEDPTERAAKRRMHDRGADILDELDKIKVRLLSGTLTVGHVIDIAGVIAVHREKIMDPALTAILDEIDLRAQVELAKMKVALDNKK